MFALLSALFGVGNFIGPLVAGRLLETHDWRVPLIVFGLVGLVFVAMIAFVSKNFTEHHEGLSEKARADALPEGVWNRNLVVVVIAAVTFGFSQYAFLSMYPTFLGRMLHLPPSSIGFIMSMFGLGVIAAVPISYFGDRMRQKWIVLIALLGGSVLGYLAFNSGDATGLHHAILSFLVGLFGGTFIANTSSLMQRSVPAMHIAKASGIYVTAVYLPASFSGYVFGTLVNSLGWGNSAMIQLAIIPALGAATLLLMKDRSRTEGTATVAREAAA
ncbi:MFS transporter [Bradyrhizobium septentrionale]|uniref:MFS transporter n=1 Tax=Bradyrhizobium septentrionale TaxID=1404411 RepID=A0ABZ2P1X3_9BRAD|nr:MFS transporter [Bradyrhizobium septentrionale]